jgi:hypothetical protein
MHYPIRIRAVFHQKSWLVQGSDNGASWTEIDRRENNSDLHGRSTVATFSVSQYGRFVRIRLCQTGPNQIADHNNQLVVMAFEFFGAIAGLK